MLPVIATAIALAPSAPILLFKMTKTWGALATMVAAVVAVEVIAVPLVVVGIVTNRFEVSIGPNTNNH